MKTYIRHLGAVCLLIALMVGMSACTPQAPSTKDNNCLTIICTTYATKEIAKNLVKDWSTLPTGQGYDSVQISILGQAGRDLHSFEPTAADLVSLVNADVFVYLGETAEPWVTSALSAVSADGVNLSMMSACEDALLPVGLDSDTCTPDGSGHDHDHDHAHSHGEGTAYDEHIWMSLRNMVTMTKAMSQTLQGLVPHAKDLISANEQAYVASLQALDTKYRDMVAESEKKEVLIADRNPFAYLMHDYGLTCHAAFPGCSSETEASFATQAKLLETVKDHGLSYIFQTEGGESSIAKTIGDATGAEVLTLHACQVMTEDERWGVDYLTIMENNFENLKKALE